MDELEKQIARDALALRRRVLEAGLVPVALEHPHCIGFGRIFGMEMRHGTAPCALALPNRKIGKYECVAPVRFELAA